MSKVGQKPGLHIGNWERVASVVIGESTHSEVLKWKEMVQEGKGHSARSPVIDMSNGDRELTSRYQQYGLLNSVNPEIFSGRNKKFFAPGS